jgi:hypothetical protein
MPRTIKGYIWKERQRDDFEEMKAIKYYEGIYGKDQIKVLSMKNQFGQYYIDIYLKAEAKPVRELTAMFGSAMEFKNLQTGQLSGDRILIKKS